MTMKPHVLFALVASASLSVGCKRDAPKPDPGSTAVVPSATPPTVPIVEDSSPVTTTRDAQARTMHVVAFRPLEWAGPGPQREPAFRIAPFRDRMIVLHAGYAFVQEGGALKLDAQVFAGAAISAAEAIPSLTGQWPDRLWGEATFNNFAGARQIATSDGAFRRVAGKWQSVPKDQPGRVTMRGDAALGVYRGEIKLVDGPGAAPEQAPADKARCPASTVAVSSLALAAAATGELFSVGVTCARDEVWLETWAAGKSTGKLSKLDFPMPKAPPLRTDQVHVAVASPKAVFIGVGVDGATHLARFDGVNVRKIDVPDEGLRALWATPDGTLWALMGAPKKAAALHRLGVDGVWTRFVPPDLSPGTVAPYRTLWAKDAETAYLASGASGPKGSAAIVVATTPGMMLGQLPDLADFFGKRDAAARVDAPAAEALKPFSDGCVTPFVTLFDVVASSPPDFPFPSTKKALSTFAQSSDVKLVEYRHDGKRKLGVIVPSREVGDALVAHVKANMKDEAPVLVCHAPAVLREVAIR